MRQGWGLMALLGATRPLTKVTADPTAWLALPTHVYWAQWASGSHSSVMGAALSLGRWLAGSALLGGRDHRQMFCGLQLITFTLFLFNCPSERALCPREGFS